MIISIKLLLKNMLKCVLLPMNNIILYYYYFYLNSNINKLINVDQLDHHSEVINLFSTSYNINNT